MEYIESSEKENEKRKCKKKTDYLLAEYKPDNNNEKKVKILDKCFIKKK